MLNIRGNPSQQEAICHFQGPCEVIAGPGSGKTFVLVERILFLITECRIPPSQILVLTFSKAAALQMQDRFRSRARELSLHSGTEVSFGTFHSVFLNLLQGSCSQSYSIISGERSRSLLRTLFCRYHTDSSPRAEDIAELASLISLFKSGADPQHANPEPSFPLLFKDYQQYLRENSLLDFDDIIAECTQMLKTQPECLRRWQERFRFFLIDEFQDINREQFEGIRLLAGESANLFVVGDDDQSIYGFRGSDPRIMIRFPEQFPTARIVKLSVNYRSLKPIVDCGQRIIRENRLRISKSPVAERKQDTLSRSREAFSCVRILPFASEAEEYSAMSLRLQEMSPGQRENCAVIFRGHRQMHGLIRTLEGKGIPYRLAASSGNQKGRDKELTEAENLLQTVKTYYLLSEELAEDHVLRGDLFQILNVPERFLLRSKFLKPVYTKSELCRVYPQGSKEREEILFLCRDLQTLQRLKPAHSCRILLHRLRCSSPLQHLFLRLAEAEAAAGAFRQALQSTTPAMLLSMKDGNSSAALQTSNPAGEEKAILLLTMHGSKGLEFDTVFLPDLNEGIFPGHRVRSQEDIEEERRLFYVAVTRAKDQLNLLYVKGQEHNPRRPSRFLEPLGVTPWE